jgi:PAS domain S-box-containing protein
MKARDERHIHVLLVEDDEEVAKTFRLMLEHHDMTVTLASHAEQALAMLSDESLSELDPDAFDVVVTDVRMEGMSGTELLKRIREKAPDLPVIVMTGYDDFNSAMDAVKYDAQDFIFKRPGSIENLAIPVKKAVHNYRLLLKNRALARELEKSEARFRDLAAMLPEIVLETDGNGKVTFMNQAGLEKFGHQAADIEQGLSLADCLIPDDAGRMRQLIELSLKKEKIQGAELTGKGAGDATFPLLISAAPIMQEGHTVGLRGLAIDISAIKRTEQELREHQGQLRSLMNELTVAEEKERRRIAVDLHESIAQLLALSKDQLSVLCRKPPTDDPNVKAALNGVRAMVSRALDQARSLTHQLSPPSLYDLGLDKALMGLVESTRETHEIVIDAKIGQPPKSLENNVKVFLFRAVQELLRNIVTHAKARRVGLTLAPDQNELRVTVTDDGVGFDPQARMGAGIGLLSIQERVQAIGGTFEVKSEAGRGARISLSVPLTKG